MTRLALSLVLTSLATSCQLAPLLTPTANLTPPASASLADIGQAVVKAGESLGWVVTIQGSGRARALLYLRDHQAQVDVFYSKTHVEIRYVSSLNLMHMEDMINRRYNKWVKNLRIRIQRDVAKIK